MCAGLQAFWIVYLGCGAEVGLLLKKTEKAIGARGNPGGRGAKIVLRHRGNSVRTAAIPFPRTAVV
jgi:hypothetical protein